MIENKWIKLGAAAFLSIGVLAGCGSSEENPELEEDIAPSEGEEDNVDRETEFEEDPAGENESNEEAEKDAKTDNLEDGEGDSNQDEN